MSTLFNPQAEDVNQVIKTHQPAVFELLSKKGKAIYFPHKGLLAQGKRAKDKDINATIGIAYEDAGGPMVLQSVACQLQLSPKEAFPYTDSFGLAALREKWQTAIYEKNPSLAGIPISLPVATCALTHGLSMIGYLFVDEGETVIVPDLYWENYDLVFENGYGAVLKKFNFFKDNVFDIDAFRQAVLAGPTGKRTVILNFPNNPSGYSPTLAAGEQIVQVLNDAAKAGNKLLVILDDAYFGLVFEPGIMKESLFARLAGLDENVLAVKVDGSTKEDYAWGFRLGFLTYGIKNGPKELYKALEDKTAGAVRGNISNVSHPAQSMILHAMQAEEYQREKQRNIDKIKDRYLEVKNILVRRQEYREYFEDLPFNSGYFMCLTLKRGLDAAKVWQKLLDDYSTGVILWESKNLLRIAFASTPVVKLEKLFDNIFHACRDIAG